MKREKVWYPEMWDMTMREFDYLHSWSRGDVWTKKVNDERNELILELRRSGLYTYEELAELFGVTKERVRQIVIKQVRIAREYRTRAGLLVDAAPRAARISLQLEHVDGAKFMVAIDRLLEGQVFGVDALEVAK